MIYLDTYIIIHILPGTNDGQGQVAVGAPVIIGSAAGGAVLLILILFIVIVVMIVIVSSYRRSQSRKDKVPGNAINAWTLTTVFIQIVATATVNFSLAWVWLLIEGGSYYYFRTDTA